MSSYTEGLLSVAGMNIILALSVYVVFATGQLSLGNAGFMAIGAYTAGILTAKAGLPLHLALVASALACAAIGVVVGLPALRLRGLFLAIVTLGFGEMVRAFFLIFPYTGGAGGFRVTRFVGLTEIWLWVAVTVAVVSWLSTTRLWLAFRAIHDDDFVAEMTGVHTTALKVGAFGLSAAIAGIAGGLFIHYNFYVEPGNFGFVESIHMVLYVILGGSGTVLGPILGASFLTVLPELLLFLGGWRHAFFGLLLTVIVLVRPRGVLTPSLLRRLTARRTEAATSGGD